jgi:hypothetical protein
MGGRSTVAGPILVATSVLVGVGMSLLLLVAGPEVLAAVSRVLVGGGSLGLVVVILVVVIGAALKRMGWGGEGRGDGGDPPGGGAPTCPGSDLDAELFALLAEEATRRRFDGHPRGAGS